MGKVLIDHSMSVDGFNTGPNVGVEHPTGNGGEQPHEWTFDRETDADAEVFDAIYAKIAAARRPPTEEAR
jgi:hypothetical protein